MGSAIVRPIENSGRGCRRCKAEFRKRTGIPTPPLTESDPHWLAWIRFQRESFEEYVTRYCDAVHRHKPGVLVCSNWLQTFRNPGEPRVPIDWVSGDWLHGMDVIRREARFMSTRGKPWDMMLWNFYCAFSFGKSEAPWNPKPLSMLKQEAAMVAALGGNVQVYETGGLRDGRLVPEHMKLLGKLGRFVKARRALCQGNGDAAASGRAALRTSSLRPIDRQH